MVAVTDQTNQPSLLPLGIITSTASKHEIKELEPRYLNFALQSAARDLLPDHRVAWCLRRVQPKRDTVDVKRESESGKAYYTGLIRCNRLWECPICSANISEKRRDQLQTALENTNLEYCMGTFTIRHNREMDCNTVLTALQTAYRRFCSGRGYKDLCKQFGVVGSCRALEITHGENGYHPHIHVLYLGKPGMKAQHEDMKFHFLVRWLAMFQDENLKPDIHGIDFSLNGKPGEYVTKITATKKREWNISDELTKQPAKSARKNGRSTKALLYDYMMGDSAAGKIWTEIVLNLSGKKQLVASRGFWDLLKIDEPKEEVTESDTEQVDNVLAKIDLITWRFICRHEFRGEVLSRIEKGENLQEILFDLYKNSRIVTNDTINP